jgi:hypothetical protein
MTHDFDRIAVDLEARMAVGTGVWSEQEFAERAFEAFGHQYSHCDPFRALCEARGVTPEALGDWRDVPLVPATAFKHFDFLSAPGPAELVFRTSGTTRGQGTRGRHHVPRSSLYRASLLPPLERALLPDRDSIRFVSLVPPPAAAPESSLSFMVGAAADRFAPRVDWVVSASGSWADGATAVWASVVEEGEPVLLLGTALSLLHALERGEKGASGLPRLPDGSRIMETGGFKGARRQIPRTELYRMLLERTGVPPERIVNEYGMTELLSQLWEPVLAEGEVMERTHLAPPWLRVRALDPTTLESLPEGRDGVLAFYDLANLGSVSHVLTDDLGSVRDGRVRLQGRAPGAEPRGCSRAMDELMTSAAR